VSRSENRTSHSLLHASHVVAHVPRLIPALADRYHCGRARSAGVRLLGRTRPQTIPLQFENLAKVIDRCTQAIGLDRYRFTSSITAACRTPVALAHPERITAIISQNGNAYRSLSQGWNPIQKYWKGSNC